MFLKFVFLSFGFTSLLGVFGDEVKSVLVMERDNLTLHTHITEIKGEDQILWSFGPQKSTIAKINREADIVSVYDDVLDGRFRDRLQVNNQTGDLTITNITTQHTGLYNVTISSEQTSLHKFNVIVYATLPVPVITTQNSSSSSSRSSCVFVCSVNVINVSLSWYKGNSLLSSISVSDLNISSISIHLKCLDDSYSCVANNPISNQTQHLNTDLCQPCSDLTFKIISAVVAVAVGCLIVALVFIFRIYRKHKNTHQQVPETLQNRGKELNYADPTFYKRAAQKTGSKDDVVYAGVKRQ